MCQNLLSLRWIMNPLALTCLFIIASSVPVVLSYGVLLAFLTRLKRILLDSGFRRMAKAADWYSKSHIFTNFKYRAPYILNIAWHIYAGYTVTQCHLSCVRLSIVINKHTPIILTQFIWHKYIFSTNIIQITFKKSSTDDYAISFELLMHKWENIANSVCTKTTWRITSTCAQEERTNYNENMWMLALNTGDRKVCRSSL